MPVQSDIFACCKQGDLDQLRVLLREGVDVNIQDEKEVRVSFFYLLY